MPISISEQLITGRRLTEKGRYKEALELISELDKKGDITSEHNLEIQILKGILYFRMENYENANIAADQVLQESQKLGKTLQSIDALLIKSLRIFKFEAPFETEMEKSNEILDHLAQIENLLKTLISESPIEGITRKGIVEIVKGYSFLVMGKYKKGIETYEKGLEYIERIENSDRWSFSAPFFLLRISKFFCMMGMYEKNEWCISRLNEEHIYDNRELLIFYLSKSFLLFHYGEFQEALKLSEIGLQKSQEFKIQKETINFLLIKSVLLRELRQFDEAEEIISQLEILLNQIKVKMLPSEVLFVKGHLNIGKSIIKRLKGELDQSLELALQGCKIFEKLGIPNWRSFSLYQVGNVYKAKGELDKAIKYSTYSLGIKQTSDFFKIANLILNLGDIYKIKGELALALEFLEKGLTLSEKIPTMPTQALLAASLGRIGWIYWLKGDTDQAIKFLERSANFKFPFYEGLFRLIIINIEIGSLNKAQEYLARLEPLSRAKIPMVSQVFRIAKALILKATKQLRNRGEAERLLKQVAEEEIARHEYTVIALVNLCDILLDKLTENNNPEVLNEITIYYSFNYNCRK
jgi:tetratricopeptide (TPR) repeat protein